jgi:hypothetical protein
MPQHLQTTFCNKMKISGMAGTIRRVLSHFKCLIYGQAIPSSLYLLASLTISLSIQLNDPAMNYTAQLPGFLEYATDNPYGIKLVNSTEAAVMDFNLNSNVGCMSALQACVANRAGILSDQEMEDEFFTCLIATSLCRNLVEGMFLSK